MTEHDPNRRKSEPNETTSITEIDHPSPELCAFLPPKSPFRDFIPTLTLPEGMNSLDLLDREDRF